MKSPSFPYEKRKRRAFFFCVFQQRRERTGSGFLQESAALTFLARTPSDRCLRHIILPLLRPTIITVCTINLIGGMKCFDLLYTMTKGGPGTATQSTTIYIYKEMFTNSHYGYSAAMSMILFIVTVFVSMLFLRMTKNKN